MSEEGCKNMLLYGSTESGHSYKVRILLLLSGLEHHYQWVNLELPRKQRPEKFIRASKFGEVPVLVVEDKAYCQSNAILQYLAQKYQVFQGQAEESSSVLEWLFWESNRIGFSLPNLRFALLYQRQAPEVLAYLRQRVESDLQALNLALASSDFLVPSGPSIADLSCSAYLFWLSQVGMQEAEYPNVQRWLRALRALPNWLHPDEAMKPTSIGH